MKRVMQNGGGKPLTLREIAEKAGVSTGTVHKMSQGDVPHCESVIRIAKAFREPVADWLDMCGYCDIAEDYRGVPIQVHMMERATDIVSQLIEELPEKKRHTAREAVKRHFKQVIVPLLSEVA